MKKRVLAVIIAVCIVAMFVPTVSRAAVTPYFVIVNDVLLPLSNENMPYIVGSEVFVPPGIFGVKDGVSVWSVVSVEQVRVYTGASRYVDFYITSGSVEDQDGNILPWPSARRAGNRFYVPLAQICDFFGLTYEVLEVNREIIPQEQMWAIRVRFADATPGFNGPTYLSMNRAALRETYNEFNAPPAPPETPPTPSAPTTDPSPGVEPPAPPTVEPPPTYNDVTIYHSFYNISAEGAVGILELLATDVASEYRFCFFISADDIRGDSGIIRRISGSGHTIGIWLKEGTYDEYVETSELLFEAAKIKTVLVSASIEAENASGMAEENGIVFWTMDGSLAYDDTLSVDAVTAMLPKVSGERQNLMSTCSEFTALMLLGIVSYLHTNEYSVEAITETTEPLKIEEMVRS